jgi:hypothetical protein
MRHPPLAQYQPVATCLHDQPPSEFEAIFYATKRTDQPWSKSSSPSLHQNQCGSGKPATRAYIFGIIRHRRDLETRQAMLRDLSRMWIRVTGQSEAELIDLIVSLTETDPANAIEAGLILPEPGRE